MLQFIPGQCMGLCECSELRGGGTREQWAGRLDRRPAVRPNVHQGTARCKQDYERSRAGNLEENKAVSCSWHVKTKRSNLSLSPFADPVPIRLSDLGVRKEYQSFLGLPCTRFHLPLVRIVGRGGGAPQSSTAAHSEEQDSNKYDSHSNNSIGPY
ncbi:hypothetical protein NQZ68_023283 [Dissostichus eleginoides]|nr:hypothetical protein NQZ68_023283 [Dissostichus eleginoides]